MELLQICHSITVIRILPPLLRWTESRFPILWSQVVHIPCLFGHSPILQTTHATTTISMRAISIPAPIAILHRTDDQRWRAGREKTGTMVNVWCIHLPYYASPLTVVFYSLYMALDNLLIGQAITVFLSQTAYGQSRTIDFYTPKGMHYLHLAIVPLITYPYPEMVAYICTIQASVIPERWT